MYSPVEFKYRCYEDCLSEVVVTHSPRYLIDMNLDKGKTIFDKISIPYDILRKEQNPIKPILNYYRSLLTEGQEVWWLDAEEERGKSIIIKFWNSLSVREKDNYVVKGFVLFPEVFKSDFNKFSLWLYESEFIICPNVRDQFTAGGRGEVNWNNKTYTDIPRIILNLFDLANEIQNEINILDRSEISRIWGKDIIHDIKTDWIDLICQYTVGMGLEFDLKNYLEENI